MEKSVLQPWSRTWSSWCQFPVSRFAQALRSTHKRSDLRLRTYEDGEFVLITLMHSIVHSGIFPAISIIQQETAFVILVNLDGFFTITSPSWLRKQALRLRHKKVPKHWSSQSTPWSTFHQPVELYEWPGCQIVPCCTLRLSCQWQVAQWATQPGVVHKQEWGLVYF